MSELSAHRSSAEDTVRLVFSIDVIDELNNIKHDLDQASLAPQSTRFQK